jgi:hypothetical protein
MSFELQSDGSWLPAGSLSDEAPVQAQAELYRRAVERNRQDAANDNKEFKVRRKPPQT